MSESIVPIGRELTARKIRRFESRSGTLSLQLKARLHFEESDQTLSLLSFGSVPPVVASKVPSLLNARVPAQRSWAATKYSSSPVAAFQTMTLPSLSPAASNFRSRLN